MCWWVYSGEYDVCDVTLSAYPHRASLKNMHIFQACPVWICTQSNITSIILILLLDNLYCYYYIIIINFIIIIILIIKTIIIGFIICLQRIDQMKRALETIFPLAVNHDHGS
jgi:hypothetical protein